MQVRHQGTYSSYADYERKLLEWLFANNIIMRIKQSNDDWFIN